MNVPKIHLSSAETELIKAMLRLVEQQQLAFVARQDGRNAELFLAAPKISRGENYLGLPYLVLDYPRQAAGDGLFFIRTMFWWGHYFSSTLHLSGLYTERFREAIAFSYQKLGDYSAGIGQDPWVHHFGEGNYRPVHAMGQKGFEDWCIEAAHLKIAQPLALGHWQEAPGLLYEQWKKLLEVCGLIA